MISTGAAILILGLLFLATSKAVLKVLGVLAVIVVVGGGSVVYWSEHQDPQIEAQRRQQVCSKMYQTEAFRSACLRDGP
jgi:Tfp pilus assembly protein PilO